MARRKTAQTEHATANQPPQRIQEIGGYTVVRDADPNQFPPPAAGRLVIALDPFTNGPPGSRWEQLALVWENDRKREVLHTLVDSCCLMMGCQHDATWLPKRWKIDVFPTGWTLPHLEYWFDYALQIAEDDKLSHETDERTAYFPMPRDLVSHAHLIVRHLRLPESPAEPRVPMDRAGCVAELMDVRDFFRRAFVEHETKGNDPTTTSRGAANPVETDPALDDEDIQIISYLATQAPRLSTVYDIQAGTTVARKTIGQRLQRFIDLNLAHRPNGPKRGAALTAKGQALAKRLPAQN
jgi:hypothetical protein